MFIALWLLLGAVFAAASGWSRLAREFPGGARPAGERLRRQVIGTGIISENGVTTLIPTSDGLYLYSHPFFRFRRPPVLVPWDRIRFIGESGFARWPRFVYDLGGVTSIRVKRTADAAIQSHLEHRAGADARDLVQSR